MFISINLFYCMIRTTTYTNCKHTKKNPAPPPPMHELAQVNTGLEEGESGILLGTGTETGMEVNTMDSILGLVGSLSLQLEVVSVSLKHLQIGTDKLQSQNPFPLHIDGQNISGQTAVNRGH